MRDFNWGIIGPGKIAHKFAQDIELLECAKIHAVASRSITRANEFANTYQATHAYGAYEDIVNCPDLDAVYIATPHSLHFENTIHCLKHKIPVLCEKSFAINLKQVQQMVNTARTHNTFLMEAFWTRFLPTHQHLFQSIKNGKIGNLKSIKADFGIRFPFDPQSRLFNIKVGGGSLLDVGIYPVFLAVWLLGKPDQIKANASFGPTQVEEVCQMIFKYNSGQMAILDSSLIYDTPCIGYIYGEKGAAQLNYRFHETKSYAIRNYNEASKTEAFEFNGFGYLYEAQEVMKCINEEKKESTLMPLQLSLDLMETLDRIREDAGIVFPDFD